MLTELEAPGEPETGTRRIELAVTGMSCLMCAARIRNRLNKIDGVHASVNFKTRLATVDVTSDVSVSELCDVVKRAGYGSEQRSVITIARDSPEIRRPRDPVARLLRGIPFRH